MNYVISVIMRYFYTHLYHSFAWSYNIVAKLVSSGNWFDWGKAIIDFIEEKDVVLEVGFGTGVLHEALIKRGFNLTGIDESSQMVQICSKRLKNFENNLKIVQGNVLDMPFPDIYFNKVIATFPGDFILEERFVFELERILKPRGTFVALIGVKFNRVNFFDWCYRLIFRATGQEITTTIEEKISLFLSRYHGFSHEISWRNFEERSLCFIVLQRF